MARPLRIEYPGAFYHVHARGNQKQPIFLSDEDRFYFLNCLRAAYEKLGAVVHAYCLMEDHYHLLNETPHGNLSKVMHLINTTYSIYFNKKHARCGHPFQGRFSAILVQADIYARELAAYVHLNPVRAGIVESPEEYAWSNYREYLRPESSQPWTRTSFVLRLFASDSLRASHLYADFVQRRAGQSLPDLLKAAESAGILGEAAFLARIYSAFPVRQSDPIPREIPQLRKLKFRPPLQTVVAVAERVLGPKNAFARNAAIYVIHKRTDYSLSEIAAHFNMSISGISDVSRKIRRELNGNGVLSKAIEEIALSIFR